MKSLSFCAALGALVLSTASFTSAGEWKSGIEWPEPPMVTPGEKSGDAPSDAIVLFDGTDLSKWNGGEKWIIKDGYAEVAKGGISTKDEYGDMQLHVEFASPEVVKGSGQGRGNSGIFLFGKYEVQVLDSYDNPTYFDGQSASIYKQSPPMVNASRKPGEWQSYDIIFNAPTFKKDGTFDKPGHVTVLHNGILVQNNFELLGATKWDSPPKPEKHGPKGRIELQFHGNPVRFRNIWLRELKPLEGKMAAPKPTEEAKPEVKKEEPKPEPKKEEKKAAEAKKPAEKKEEKPAEPAVEKKAE
ncbi:DUF1080 domain-containing protein [Blastopirellula sp. JC732]|uniref:DUF1080 domain-containing protein n=1 Tax=Blastopirellula sediminis TaxID=2894196 RepID=A0A9X1SHT4_9BACT|nr:DUF1080 domain-containing protein [Blastopirellula sediminis]MCC9607728.1 DUF1080 domain-containing protein [Blastopirellula sediminis]MCC9627479.1 DUF1080 domain-containing protein [Blastopirellula sediminis]